MLLGKHFYDRNTFFGESVRVCVCVPGNSLRKWPIRKLLLDLEYKGFVYCLPLVFNQLKANLPCGNQVCKLVLLATRDTVDCEMVRSFEVFGLVCLSVDWMPILP